MGPDNAKDIWILGAGFSRQLHRGMPLMSDLAKSVRDIISDRFDNSLVLNNVELALSELRSDAPWKSPIAKYADLALNERVVERIRDQLQIPWDVMRDNRENLAHRLVNTWHIGEIHVLTFNYDLLIEAAAQRVQLKNWWGKDAQKVRFLYPYHIYPVPIAHLRTRNGIEWRGASTETTFSYYKLHGSLNYYTYPDQFQNQDIYHRDHNQGEGASMERYQGKEWAEGLRPFIVPPTNAKQTFLEHPVLQTMWAKAAKVLANCDCGRIIMVGYSMPETDLTVLSMLREAIRSNLRADGRLWPEILVVNPDPEAALRIKKLLGVRNPVGQVTKVAEFLEQYAPAKFVRTHVHDNKDPEDIMKEQQIYQKSGGDLSQEDIAFLQELRNKAIADGRQGEGWFLSREERRNWYRSIYQDIPVERWL